MDKYRTLNKDMERLSERRQIHIDNKEFYNHTAEQLAHRRKQLISELTFIYPISTISKVKNIV